MDIAAETIAAAQEARTYLEVVTDSLPLDDDEVGYVIGKSGRQVCGVISDAGGSGVGVLRGVFQGHSSRQQNCVDTLVGVVVSWGGLVG